MGDDTPRGTVPAALTDAEWEQFCRIAISGSLVKLRNRYRKARQHLRGVREDEWSSWNAEQDAEHERNRAAALIRRELAFRTGKAVAP